MTCIAERDPLHASAGRSIKSGGCERLGRLFIGVVGAHFCQAFRSRKIYPAARMRSSGLTLRKSFAELVVLCRLFGLSWQEVFARLFGLFLTSRNLRQMENRRRSVSSVKRRLHVTVELRTSKGIWSASTHTPSK